jgi:hypothetical protein
MDLKVLCIVRVIVWVFVLTIFLNKDWVYYKYYNIILLFYIIFLIVVHILSLKK